MMIRVKYQNGITGMVRPSLLKQLIRSQKIIEFRRADGWVALEKGKLRGSQRTSYSGKERRHAV